MLEVRLDTSRLETKISDIDHIKIFKMNKLTIFFFTKNNES